MNLKASAYPASVWQSRMNTLIASVYEALINAALLCYVLCAVTSVTHALRGRVIEAADFLLGRSTNTPWFWALLSGRVLGASTCALVLAFRL